MDLDKIYTDSDGKECNILQMVKSEPEWAANRIQTNTRASVGLSEEVVDIIKELKCMIMKSESPLMDNSHILDTRKADKMLTNMYQVLSAQADKRKKEK